MGTAQQDPLRAEAAAGRSSAGWAFEFLRRNPEFANIVRAINPGRRAASSDAQIVALPERDSRALAKFGVLYCDRTDAQIGEASVFWLPAANGDVLGARVVSALAESEANGMLRLDQMACTKIVLSVPGGADQLLLRDSARSVQINCIDGDCGDGAAAIVPQIAPHRNVDRQLLNLRRLLHLYTEGCLSDHLFKPDGRSGRFAEVLTALDGWLERRPLRDIATALYGERIVEADWAPEGGYLIERVRRSIRRGRYLMAGGYRELLE